MDEIDWFPFQSNPQRFSKKELIDYLFKRKLIVCPICPLNRKENSKRRQRTDRHKDHRI